MLMELKEFRQIRLDDSKIIDLVFSRVYLLWIGINGLIGNNIIIIDL